MSGSGTGSGGSADAKKRESWSLDLRVGTEIVFSRLFGWSVTTDGGLIEEGIAVGPARSLHEQILRKHAASYNVTTMIKIVDEPVIIPCPPLYAWTMLKVIQVGIGDLPFL
jgi:hypothetical protein